VQRFAAQCSAFQHVKEEMQNEANVNLVNISRAWSGIRSQDGAAWQRFAAPFQRSDEEYKTNPM
jgi:hypothetical protein